MWIKVNETEITVDRRELKYLKVRTVKELRKFVDSIDPQRTPKKEPKAGFKTE